MIGKPYFLRLLISLPGRRFVVATRKRSGGLELSNLSIQPNFKERVRDDCAAGAGGAEWPSLCPKGGTFQTHDDFHYLVRV
jgi:hypothetical protein